MADSAGAGKDRESDVKLKSAGKTAGTTSLTQPAGGRKRSVKMPPLLLERDEPSAAPVGGPGQRYALGPTPPQGHSGAAGEPGELPEAYGTGKLLVAARDPNWLYAHWDLTRDQLRDYNRRSADGHLVLRGFVDRFGGEPVVEAHVHPESTNWFLHVGRSGTQFVVELGYYAGSDRRWTRVALSTPTLTPPDSLSPDTSVHFATIPVEVPFERLLAVVKTALSENVPLAEALLQLRAEGYKGLPAADDMRAARWTPAQERALARLISMDEVRRVWIGSLEVTELVRRQLAEELASAAAARFSLPGEQRGARGVASISSPFGGAERRKGFWFNVNAELVIYGATEPDARVTIAGRDIKLRPDGSFSFRFALPDGQYQLPVVAISADQGDRREADLNFGRRTEYRGDVGAHPQDSRLEPPRAQSIPS